MRSKPKAFRHLQNPYTKSQDLVQDVGVEPMKLAALLHALHVGRSKRGKLPTCVAPIRSAVARMSS